MNLAGALVDFARELTDLLHDQVGLDVCRVVVARQLAADLVLALGSDQQDCPLHRCEARQDQVQENEWVLIKPDVSVADHPAGEEDKCCEYETPRTHAIAKPVSSTLAPGELVSRPHRRVGMLVRPFDREIMESLHSLSLALFP